VVHLTLNALSLDRQYATPQALESSLAEVIGCLDMVLFALTHGAATLWFDGQIEDRAALASGATLRTGINKLERDLVRKWYLYTRNHAALAGGELVDIEVTSTASPNTVSGAAYDGPLRANAQWISFSGIVVFHADALKVTRLISREQVHVGNAAGVAAFQAWWPRFEPSPKHRAIGYRAASGEWVSPMPLNGREAQEALELSHDEGGARIAAYKGRRFRFMLTHPKGNVYHGFEHSDPS
jgi:hypothetical protein